MFKTCTLTLFTSGSTKDPKEIFHQDIFPYIQRSVNEIKLTEKDIVLDVYPGNTIAHYTVTAMPAHIAGSKLITAKFDPYSYIKLFNKYQPTYISLIPRHWEILSKTKDWKNFDMSSVRYMVVGSGFCSQEMIDSFRERGVKIVANWYGMTEFPPPIFIGYNSEIFDMSTIDNKLYDVKFIPYDDNLKECIVNQIRTGDLFNNENKFVKRISNENNKTWKNNN